MATIEHNGKLVHLTPVERSMASARVDGALCSQLNLNTVYVMVMNHVFLPLEGEQVDEIEGLTSYTHTAKMEFVAETLPVTVTWEYGADCAVVSDNDGTVLYDVTYVGVSNGNLGTNLEFFCQRLEDSDLVEYELFVKTKVKLNREE